MNFVETIFSNLKQDETPDPLIEVQGKELVPTTAHDLLQKVCRIRAYFHNKGIKPGDRVALLAPNSINWTACDLAILASGAISVPLYSRQEPKELAFMLNDCAPKLLITADKTLSDAVEKEWSDKSSIVRFDELFETEPADIPIHSIDPKDPVTIVYTSGTSGNPKGAIITAGNADYMLEQTASRLRAATGNDRNDHNVFHYLPVCFMGSRILLWTQLHRGNPLMLSTDLTNLAEEIATADPEYFLNVPALLDRIRTAVTQKMKARGGIFHWLYKTGLLSRVVRARIGNRLQFLICGSAALSEETQRWFENLKIPVLQVYGLTETTAIVTMDQPGHVKTGWTGYPVEGCETKLTDQGELICRGPNIFPGYWNREKETAETVRDGWLHTGDQAEIDSTGNIRIIGRIKNVLVPASGHNIAPEPIEQQLVESCPGAEHAVLIGHGKPFLAAIVTGKTRDADIVAAITRLNETVPHYRKVRSYHHASEPLTPESGLLTANQKLRRKAIEEHFRTQIDQMYRKEDSAS